MPSNNNQQHYHHEGGRHHAHNRRHCHRCFTWFTCTREWSNANMMIATIASNNVVIHLLSLLATNKKSWITKLKEGLITLLFLRPFVDASEQKTMMWKTQKREWTRASSSQRIATRLRAGFSAVAESRVGAGCDRSHPYWFRPSPRGWPVPWSPTILTPTRNTGSCSRSSFCT